MLPRPAPLRRARPGLFAAALAAVLATCSPAPPSPDDPDGLLAALARETRGVPTAGPAFSVPTRHRACPEEVPEGGTVPRSECGDRQGDAGPPARSTARARATAALAERVSPGALRTLALLDLVGVPHRAASLDRSIDDLAAAVRLSGHPADAWTDLSAAYLLRAAHGQTPRDLLEALEAAEQALAVEPGSASARFNRALAAERLGLVDVAAWAWREYLAVDGQSTRADEARRRLAALEAIPPRPALPDDADEAAARAFAARAPQEALVAGWERVLPAWGEAVLRGDTAAARSHLRRAEALGGALEAGERDASLADAVGAVRERSGDAARTRRLARAHAAYGRARATYLALDYPGADSLFGALGADRSLPPALAGWAAAHHGATRVYLGDGEGGTAALTRLAQRVDTLRHPAIAARVRWFLSTTATRANRPGEALQGFRAAEALLERAGETEHRATMVYLAAEAESTLGRPAAAFASMHRAGVLLRPYRSSVWLHNLLGVLADAAAREGLTRAGARIQQEDVAVAERIGGPYALEARLSRVRIEAGVRDGAELHGELQAVRRELEGAVGLNPTVAKWLTGALHLSHGVVALRGDPAAAERDLGSAVGHFQGRTAVLYVRSLLYRTEARVAGGRWRDAEADAEQVLALLEQHRDASGGGAQERAGEARHARRLVDALVMQRLARGDTTGALALLERGRAAVAAVSPGRARSLRLPPPGEVRVRFALVADTLLAWTLSDRGTRLYRAGVDRAALARTVDEARLALERGQDGPARGALRRLHSLLAAPVAAAAGPADTALVVVPDAELASVPFAALLDGASGEFLAQRFSVRVASGLHEARDGERRGGAAAAFVADPAFDEAAFPVLERLDGAADEVARIAPAYPGARVLAGAEAGASAVAAALAGSEVFHFAGHAVFDDQRPELSHLVVAPDSAGSTGRLTAVALQRLDLRGVRLVVLSACSTLRTPRDGGGGFAGLTGALLGAGADGVVGSLWRVGDHPTRELMVRFHRHFRETGHGPGALRRAQLEMLASPDPRLRSPSAWAGFQYAGT